MKYVVPNMSTTKRGKMSRAFEVSVSQSHFL